MKRIGPLQVTGTGSFFVSDTGEGMGFEVRISDGTVYGFYGSLTELTPLILALNAAKSVSDSKRQGVDTAGRIPLQLQSMAIGIPATGLGDEQHLTLMLTTKGVVYECEVEKSTLLALSKQIQTLLQTSGSA